MTFIFLFQLGLFHPKRPEAERWTRLKFKFSSTNHQRQLRREAESAEARISFRGDRCAPPPGLHIWHSTGCKSSRMNQHDNNHILFHSLNQRAMQTIQFSEQLYFSISESELESLLQQSFAFLDDHKVLNDIGLYSIPEDREEPVQQNVHIVAEDEERRTKHVKKDTSKV